MQITTRGVLLIGAVTLITLKLAGVLSWPWLAILIPAIVYLLPFIWWLACTVGAVAIALLTLVVIGVVGLVGLIHESITTRRWKKKRTAQLKRGAVEGPWDYPA